VCSINREYIEIILAFIRKSPEHLVTRVPHRIPESGQNIVDLKIATVGVITTVGECVSNGLERFHM
jgi:hypothetical protein